MNSRPKSVEAADIDVREDVLLCEQKTQLLRPALTTRRRVDQIVLSHPAATHLIEGMRAESVNVGKLAAHVLDVVVCDVDRSHGAKSRRDGVVVSRRARQAIVLSKVRIEASEPLGQSGL